MSKKSPFSEQIEKMLTNKDKKSIPTMSFHLDTLKKINTKYLGFIVSSLLLLFIFIYRKKYLYDKDKKQYSISKIIIYLLLGIIPSVISYYI
jgi:hypothetical protein